MKNMKGFVVLLIAALLTGGILLFTEAQLRPVIEAAGSGEDQAVLEKIFEGATFKAVEFADETGLIKKVYEAEGAGYAYILENKGFADVITFALGFDNDGTIAGYEIINLNDTPGYGSQVGEDAFIGSVVGKTSVDGIATISGATVSSSAVVNAIDAAKAHFNETMGIEDNGQGEKPAPAEPEKKGIVIFSDSQDNLPEVLEQTEEGSVVTFVLSAPGFHAMEGGAANKVEVKINKDTNTVESVVVLAANDTPELGDRITSESFLEQFKGISFDDKEASVDAISGATVSSISVAKAVRIAFETLNN